MFNQGYDKKKLVILISLAVTVILFIVAASLISYFINNKKNYGVLRIQNYSEMVKNLSSNTRDSIEASLYNIVKDNSTTEPNTLKDVYIRKDSATQNEVKRGIQYSGSFIVDIASIKQSYRVGYNYSRDPGDGFAVGYPITATCLNDSELIYGSFDCKSVLSVETSQTDPVLKLVPYSTLDYTITAFLDLDNDRHITLTVTLLLTGADRQIDEVAATARYKSEAEAWLNNQGLDLSKYTVKYVTN